VCGDLLLILHYYREIVFSCLVEYLSTNVENKTEKIPELITENIKNLKKGKKIRKRTREN